MLDLQREGRRDKNVKLVCLRRKKVKWPNTMRGDWGANGIHVKVGFPIESRYQEEAGGSTEGDVGIANPMGS